MLSSSSSEVIVYNGVGGATIIFTEEPSSSFLPAFYKASYTEKLVWPPHDCYEIIYCFREVVVSCLLFMREEANALVPLHFWRFPLHHCTKKVNVTWRSTCCPHHLARRPPEFPETKVWSQRQYSGSLVPPHALLHSFFTPSTTSLCVTVTEENRLVFIAIRGFRSVKFWYIHIIVAFSFIIVWLMNNSHGCFVALICISQSQVVALLLHPAY